MRPPQPLLSLCLGLFLFAGLATVAESANQPVQVAQATAEAPTTETATQPKKTGISGSVILVVLVAVLVLIAMAMFGGEDFDPAPVGTTFYDVDDDDAPFIMGDFWFEGTYYRSGESYKREKDQVYTNRMYNANFETWGLGQGRDEEHDEMVLKEIEAHRTATGLGATLEMSDLEVAELNAEEDADSPG